MLSYCLKCRTKYRKKQPKICKDKKTEKNASRSFRSLRIKTPLCKTLLVDPLLI